MARRRRRRLGKGHDERRSGNACCAKSDRGKGAREKAGEPRSRRGRLWGWREERKKEKKRVKVDEPQWFVVDGDGDGLRRRAATLGGRKVEEERAREVTTPKQAAHRAPGTWQWQRLGLARVSAGLAGCQGWSTPLTVLSRGAWC